MAWQRLLGSMCLALVVVAVLFALGLNVYGLFQDQEDEMVFHEVELLTAVERARFAEQLGESNRRRAPKLPPLNEIPPVTIERSVQGFVQLEVDVDEAGSVLDVRVLDATPPGVYEQRAIDEVRQRRYPPAEGAGPDRRLEIIEFSVPATTAEP